MLKILCIGNSFGSDSQRYLWGTARADGKDIKAVNLYIGGCSLYRHYRNMLSGEAVYNYEINGHRTDLMVSLGHVLLMEEWDIIYTQQPGKRGGRKIRALRARACRVYTPLRAGSEIFRPSDLDLRSGGSALQTDLLHRT